MNTLQTLEQTAPAPFDEAQKTYLTGFFAGVQQRAAVFADLFAIDPMVSAPVKTAAEEPPEPPVLTAEERIKLAEHPLDAYHRILENARGNAAPDREDTFRFKWNGLFYQNPVHDSYMARLRIPGGQLKSFQLREIARVAQDLTTGYVQITTRANFQIRSIKPKDAPEVLRRIQSVGLHTRGAGADNIRNLTCNPTAGLDPAELIDCTPMIHDLAQIIISQREFYDLPRKFNIAFDGGGLVSAAEDTNDIGIKAVMLDGEVLFRIGLGGATGHQKFASDAGVVVLPAEIVPVVTAMLRVFIKNGNRSNRKKSRLKHLLETWPVSRFVEETEKQLGRPLRRVPVESTPMIWPSAELPHPQVGAYEQKQPGLHWLGVSIPVGQITPRQMMRLAELAENYGSGDIRLTVWQNLILPNIPTAWLETVKKAVEKMGLRWRQTNVASGVVACTGSRYCKFAATDTKGHALALTKYLEKKLELDQPVNIHFTGCPNSCAQHYMGDIGLLGTKTAAGTEAYHIFVGGGFGKNQACGRQVFSAMPFDEVRTMVETMLTAWLENRQSGESFQSFTTRHDLNALQVLFCG
ncbi:MAG: NirA family protein [Verrucomicrobiaceae bacterium]|nr:MAG: NirA family protein [Verrucomicrobiaceae bacterium]